MAREVDPTILALDVGTTACRAVVFSARGEQLAERYEEYASTYGAGGIVEQDAETWWRLGVRCAREAVEAADARKSVAAIGLSSQGHSWVPVDAGFQPLHNAICWLDTRAVPEVEEALARIDGRRAARTAGKLLGPWHMLAQVLWFRKHKPDVLEDAAKWLMCADFMLARLTGKAVTDPTMAAGSYLLDVAECAWSEWLIGELGIDRGKLPEIKWPGAVVGPLTEAAASDLSLRSGIPVVLGGQDQKCAAFGAGIAPGRATISLGTATAVSALADSAAFDESLRIPVFPSLLPGRWVVEAPIGTTGAALRWARDAIGDRDYEALGKLAAASPIGARGVSFLPYLSGAISPHWRPDARGAFLGLDLATDRRDLIRAVMEGVAAEIALNVDAVQRASGDIAEVVLFGGGARSQLWAEMICGMLGRTLLVASMPEAAALGAAALAACGAGFHASADEAFSAFRPEARTLRPDPGAEGQWAAVRARYEELRPRVIAGVLS